MDKALRHQILDRNSRLLSFDNHASHYCSTSLGTAWAYHKSLAPTGKKHSSPDCEEL